MLPHHADQRAVWWTYTVPRGWQKWGVLFVCFPANWILAWSANTFFRCKVKMNWACPICSSSSSTQNIACASNLTISFVQQKSTHRWRSPLLFSYDHQETPRHLLCDSCMISWASMCIISSWTCPCSHCGRYLQLSRTTLPGGVSMLCSIRCVSPGFSVKASMYSFSILLSWSYYAPLAALLWTLCVHLHGPSYDQSGYSAMNRPLHSHHFFNTVHFNLFSLQIPKKSSNGGGRADLLEILNGSVDPFEL